MSPQGSSDRNSEAGNAKKMSPQGSSNRNSEAGNAKKPSLKESFKKFAGATLPLMMYLSDAGFDTSSSVDFCMEGETWWCALSAGFIILPEVIVSAYIAWSIWKDKDKKDEDGNDVKKEDFAVLSSIHSATWTNVSAILIFALVPTMILPFVMLPWLSYKALRGGEAKNDAQGTTTATDTVNSNTPANQEGTNTAAATVNINTPANQDEAAAILRKTTLAMLKLKGMEALLQASPQLSLKSYIVIHKLHCLPGYNNTESLNLTLPAENNTQYQEYCQDVWDMWDRNDAEDQGIDLLEVISPFQSLLSLCFSIASLVVDEHNEIDWYAKIVWFIALFSSIGSRMMVCGVLASWNQVLWIVPPLTACAIALATKKLRHYCSNTGTTFTAKHALKVVLEQGLLLSYPSIEGLLACASYTGFAIWFFTNGTLIDGGANAELGIEALSVCIVGQLSSMVIAFIASRLGYHTPFHFLIKPGTETLSTETDDSTQTAEDIITTRV